MKKAFDQTVRDLKREVNKKVLKVSGIEQKILDATNNEPWGPHGSHLSDIAQATRNIHEYHMIMTVIWKRINDTGKNWRHVYKALTVLEYLVVHGSERVIDEIREHAYQISTLSSFQYIDSSGKDQGSNVRRKSQNIVSLVNNKEKVYEVRQKALANQDKHRSTQSTGRSSYPSPGGSDDRYDDDRYKVHGRDEERYSDRRERESGYRDVDRYERNGDTYSQEGDGYVRDSDERYGRGNNATGNYQMGSRNRSINGDNSFHDDDHYSSRTDDPLQDERSSEQSLGAPPSYEEATRDSQGLAEEGRNGGNIADSAAEESTLNKGPLGSKSQDPGSPAAFVFTPVQNLEHNCFDAFDPRESVSVAPPAADHLGPPSVNGLDVDIFGSLSSPDLIYSLDAMPATSTDARVEATVPGNAAIGSEFCTYSLDPTSASNMFNQPSGNPFGDPPFEANQETFPAQQESFAPLPSFEPSIPSGSSGVPSVLANVEAIAGFDLDSFGGANYVPFSTDGSGTLQSVTSNIEADMTLGFEDSFDGTNYTPLSTIQHNNVTHHTKFPLELPANQLSHDISSLLAPQLSHDISSVLAPQNGPAAFFHSQAVQPTASAHTEANFLQSPQLAPFTSRAAQVTLQGASPSSSGIQSTPLNLLSQQGGSPAPIIEGNTTMPTLSPAKNPSVDKFETKSTVWADTLRRGLVNLNISGPKTNPHADIGIDFDSMNRKEKRNEEKKSSAAPVVSNITMGKAMGSGSGIGRAGAGGLAAPPNHMMGSNMGMGMNIAGNPVMGIGSGMGIYGGSMNQPLGMGMGMNMGIRTSMGMNMGMNQGMPMNPPMGMPPGGAGMMPGMPPGGAGMMPGMPPGGASMMPGMSNGGPGMMLGAGYNGMMTGTGSYNFQHPYGGGYGQGN